MGSPSITVNTYNTGPTGHVNVTFRDGAGNHVGTFGSNIDIGSSSLPGSLGGVFNENPGRVPTYTHTLLLSEGAFSAALEYARNEVEMTRRGAGDYSLLFKNCYDFVDDVLVKAGLPNNSARLYVEPGSLVDHYGEIQKFLMDQLFEAEFGRMVQDPYYQPISAFQLQGALTFMQGQGSHTYNEDGWEIEGKINRVQYETWVSPIAIDLNGDGLHSISLAESSVKFDFDGTGAKIAVSWLDSNDGFLAIDLNSNGAIDNGLELFGGREIGSAFAKLREYDSNTDGVIDSRDAKFGELRIWQDANANGKTDSGELSNLADRAISQLSIRSVFASDELNDAIIVERSEAVMGSCVVDMSDIFFRAAGF